METTKDTDGIMEKIGNASTEVVHFELCFEGEGVVLAPSVYKYQMKLYFTEFLFIFLYSLKFHILFRVI